MIASNVVLVYEPRESYQSNIINLCRSEGYRLALVTNLLKLPIELKSADNVVVLIDSELTLGENTIYDIIPALIKADLLGRLVFLTPSKVDRTRLDQLASLEPLDVISRVLQPRELRERLSRLFLDVQRTSRQRKVARGFYDTRAFVNSTYEKDCDLIKDGCAGGAGSYIAYKVAEEAGDSMRAVKHLVDAFKVMPYSYCLYEKVLMQCGTSRGIYKASAMFLKSHPPSSPFFGIGLTRALQALSGCRETSLLRSIASARLSNRLF